MNDKADVGFVNAHAKGVGGHHHCGPVVEKILLVLLPLLIRQAGVVSGGGKALIPQGLAHLLHGLAGGAVDNAAFVPALLQQPQCFLKFVLGPANLKIQVRPVKAGDCHPGVPQLKQGENILPHPGRGGGGKGRDHRPLGKSADKLRNGQIAGPEVLPPLGDTVGLVNGDHGNGGAFGKVQKFRGQQTLRRHIDDLVHSGLGVSQGGPVLAPAQGAVEIGPPHAVLYQGAHLVPHQRD